MFPHALFPDALFPDALFPGASASAAPATPAAGFFEAFAAWFAADAVCSAACPGGMVDAQAAPLQAYPYARVWDLENHEPVSPEDVEVEVALSVYAANDNAGTCGDSLARAAGATVMNRLLDPVARGDWLFEYGGEDWREGGCLWIPPGKVSPAGKAAGGLGVWRYDLWFKFYLVKAD